MAEDTKTAGDGAEKKEEEKTAAPQPEEEKEVPPGTDKKPETADEKGGDEENRKTDGGSAEKAQALLAQYIRLQADFDNFRRRSREEQSRASAVITSGVLKEFLPVLDNFDIALTHMEKDPSAENYIKGFELLYRQFNKILEGFGVKEMEAEGKPFNPHFHEAVMQVSSDTYEDDTVAAVLQKGYMIQDTVLRPAKVQVVQNN